MMTEDELFWMRNSHGVVGTDVIRLVNQVIQLQAEKNDKCRWIEQPEDLMVWDIEWLTSCGGSFGLDREEGKPSENDYVYCPKCGRRIEEVPIISEDEA